MNKTIVYYLIVVLMGLIVSFLESVKLGILLEVAGAALILVNLYNGHSYDFDK